MTPAPLAVDPSSREAEAQAEIAATRIAPGALRALVAVPIALFLLWSSLEVAALARGESRLFAPLEPVTTPSTGLRGRLDAADQTMAEIEARFDERSVLVRATRPPLQASLTRFFDTGNEKAIVGEDGWLFFRDDVEHLTSRRPGADFAGDPESSIRAFRDELARRDIVLLLVPTPLKPTVHPERLARRATAPVRRAGEAELLARLEADGVEVVDLAERFARDAELAPLYLATDTHWRPEAVEIAAREIALRLREIAELPPGRPLPDEPRERFEGRGDTAALLDLPAGSGLYPRESVELRPVPASGGSPAGAGTRAPVLLLGDSFSAMYSVSELGWGRHAGLADRLSAGLGLPVDRIVRNAGGASATRDALARELASDPTRLDGVRAVVWQLATRELSQGDWEQP